MLDKKIRIGFIITYILLVLSFLLIAATAFLLTGLFFRFPFLPESLELNVLLIAIGYILSVAVIFSLAFLSGHIRKMRADNAFFHSLFGDRSVDVVPEDSYVKEIKKIKKSDQDFYIVFGLAIKSIGGEGSISSIGSSLLYSINTLIYEFAKESTKNIPTKMCVDSHNNYFLAVKSNNEEASIDSFRQLIFHLSNEFEKRDDIPYAVFLLSSASTKDKKNLTETCENCRYALWRNASSRVSCDLLVYDEALREEETRQKELDVELERALKNEELIIYYQAKFSLKTHQFYGAEALLRWKHPKRGLLPPAVFIPYCENSGKIVEIDRYVYEHVCRDLKAWKEEGQRRIVVSVNLSRRSVYDPGLLEFLETNLKSYAIDPSTLDIELTESLAAQNLTFIRDIIKRIKRLGFETSIDDFGVGYSSLSSLKNIPFDVLKIDKSFVDDIEIDAKARSMITSIIHMAHDFGMSVIAEGVETSAQNDILDELGLDAIQGYYYSRPADKAHFDALLVDNPFEKEEGDYV